MKRENSAMERNAVRVKDQPNSAGKESHQMRDWERRLQEALQWTKVRRILRSHHRELSWHAPQRHILPGAFPAEREGSASAGAVAAAGRPHLARPMAILLAVMAVLLLSGAAYAASVPGGITRLMTAAGAAQENEICNVSVEIRGDGSVRNAESADGQAEAGPWSIRTGGALRLYLQAGTGSVIGGVLVNGSAPDESDLDQLLGQEAGELTLEEIADDTPVQITFLTADQYAKASAAAAEGGSAQPGDGDADGAATDDADAGPDTEDPGDEEDGAAAEEDAAGEPGETGTEDDGEDGADDGGDGLPAGDNDDGDSEGGTPAGASETGDGKDDVPAGTAETGEDKDGTSADAAETVEDQNAGSSGEGEPSQDVENSDEGGGDADGSNVDDGTAPNTGIETDAERTLDGEDAAAGEPDSQGDAAADDSKTSGSTQDSVAGGSTNGSSGSTGSNEKASGETATSDSISANGKGSDDTAVEVATELAADAATDDEAADADQENDDEDSDADAAAEVTGGSGGTPRTGDGFAATSLLLLGASLTAPAILVCRRLRRRGAGGGSHA